MAVKDHTQHLDGLKAAPTPVAKQVDNTVSRGMSSGDRSFFGLVHESGKAVLDSELNFKGEIERYADYLLQRWQTPSGWLRGRTNFDSYDDFTVSSAPGAFLDESDQTDVMNGGLRDGDHILGDRTMIDAFLLPKLEAVVAGMPVVVEYVNVSEPGQNLVILNPAQVYDGTNLTVKRTDFVFLEVWKALVAPSVKASGQVQVAVIGDLAAADKITIDGNDLTAVVGAPGVDQFQMDADAGITASNIAAAINDPGNAFFGTVSAKASGDTVFIKAATPGAAGNAITLAVTVANPGSLAPSGATLTLGADRPYKPADAQNKIFRHGNVQSPPEVWLDDEMTDPVIDLETTQRVQVQYRIRVTGTPEGMNFKKHPDGFSNPNGGDPTVHAQGGRNQPVNTASGDSADYPFVPADGVKVWGKSSAAAFGHIDNGLWIAGDGSKLAAQELGAVDGFVYAIPLTFVFRHNDVSSALAGFKGWDPVNNTNGAPKYEHAAYVGPTGSVPVDTSDRPDGGFCDVIEQVHLWDARRHVLYPGVDLASQLQFQMQSLLDGNYRTWAIDMASKQTLGNGSGDQSTLPLVCNEIGRSPGAGGGGGFAGDTNRGVLIRDFDHICRRFGDQSVIERVLVAFYPGDRQTDPGGADPQRVYAPGTANEGKYVIPVDDPSNPGVPAGPDTWYEGDTLVFDLEALNAMLLGGFFHGLSGGGNLPGAPANNTTLEFSPDEVVITDVLEMWHDDGNSMAAEGVPQQMHPRIIKGLGTSKLEIVLDRNDVQFNGGADANPNNRAVGYVRESDLALFPGTGRRIFVEMEITYPVGEGLTDTPDLEVAPDPTFWDDQAATLIGPGPVMETSTTQRPKDYEGLLEPRFRTGFREVQLEYVANATNSHAAVTAAPIQDTVVSRTALNVYFPRRVYDSNRGPWVNTTHVEDISAGGAAVRTIDTNLSEFGSSSRKVVLDAGTPLAKKQSLCAIEYYAQDPIPNYGADEAGYQVGVYFRTNAPQTAGSKEGDITTQGDGVLPTTLKVEPLLVSDHVWSGQVGMGSNDATVPYSAPLDQIPLNQLGGVVPEWKLMATAQVSVADFAADTGLLALHTFLPQDMTQVLSVGSPAVNDKPRVDGDFRAYYPFADDSTYRPTVLAQPLTGATRHKAFVPFMARAIEDVTGQEGGIIFRKGELLLMVVSRYAKLDTENNVLFESGRDDTTVAVYRTKNLLLVVGDR